MVPELAFDSHVTGDIAGGAGDLGGTGLDFGTDRLDVSWFNNTPGDVGTVTIGRLTLTDDAAGTMSLMTHSQVFDVTIAPDVAPAITEVIEELQEAPEEVVAPEPSAFETSSWYYPTSWRYDDPRIFVAPSLDDSLRHRYLDFPPIPLDSRRAAFYDGRIVDKYPTRTRTLVPVEDTSSDQTLPEPGTLAVIAACGGIVMLRRRTHGME